MAAAGRRGDDRRVAMRALDTLPAPLAFVLRHLLIGVPLAAFIALFLAIAFEASYAGNFVYSLCIGLICQFVDRRSAVAARRARCVRWGTAPRRRGAAAGPAGRSLALIIVLGVAAGPEPRLRARRTA